MKKLQSKICKAHFDIVECKTNKYQCRFCRKKIVQHSTKITKHILQCSEVPENIKQNIREETKISDTNNFEVMEDNIRKMNSSEQIQKEDLWELLARAIFVSGTPFTIVENTYWKKFFKALKPNFVLPSRKWLSTNLLDKEFVRTQAQVQQAVQSAKSFCIQTDSWSNVNGEPIVNIVMTIPKLLVFKTIYTGTTRHTGEYYATEIKNAILLGGKEKCISVCTDNEATMVKARRLVSKDPEICKLPIADVGCGSHILNLYIEDILKNPTPQTIKTKVLHLIVSINASRVLKEQLKVIQKEVYTTPITLATPVDTRWGYIVPCIQSVCKNRSALTLLVNCKDIQKNVSDTVKSTILDNEFWIQAEQLCFLLEPIKVWIANFESNTSCLSDVYFAMKEIYNHLQANLPLSPLSNEEEKDILNLLKKRTDMLLRPIHFAGNILNPLHQGEKLSKEEMNCGIKYIKELSHSLLSLNADRIASELHDYLNHKGFWDNDFLWNAAKILEDKNRIWWNSLCGSTLLGKTASSILTVPVTSSATERSFSSYGHIHTKKRNKLTAERAGKVLYISYNLRALAFD